MSAIVPAGCRQIVVSCIREHCASEEALYKDPQVYPISVHVVLGASVREARKRVSGRQQADSMQYLGFELLRTHQPVEKVVVGPVGGPKQGQNTTERRFESLIRG
jgi:hypothetical protein